MTRRAGAGCRQSDRVSAAEGASANRVYSALGLMSIAQSGDRRGCVNFVLGKSLLDIDLSSSTSLLFP